MITYFLVSRGINWLKWYLVGINGTILLGIWTALINGWKLCRNLGED